MKRDQIVCAARPLRIEDVDAAAKLYAECFPEAWPVGLGFAFLKHFYRQIVKDPQSFGCVLEHPDTKEAVGFIVGTLNSRFYADVVTSGLRITLFGAIKGLFTCPALRQSAFHSLRSGMSVFRTQGVVGMDEAGIEPAKGPVAKLIQAAIAPACRGKGNAERLGRHFSEKMFALGAGRVASRVASDNPAAVSGCRSAGWNIQRTSQQSFHMWLDRPESLPPLEDVVEDDR